MQKRRENRTTWILGVFLMICFSVTLSAFLKDSRPEPSENQATISRQEKSPQMGEARQVMQMQDLADRGRSQDPINLLLIGQDQKPEELGKRSDSIILCTICPRTQTMVLTSILRDLYVEIPGYEKNRVNAAYSFGGAELLEQVLSDSLGISVQGHMEVDFAQFVKLVDLLGGVPVELRQDEAREINRVMPYSQLAAGSATLNGEQALVYSRIRRLDADADVSRSNRQRKVLEQIFRQYQSASPRQLIQIMGKALPMISTDMSGREILSCAAALLPMMKELKVVSCRIPAEGTYRDLTVRGMAVLDADLQANRKQMVNIMTGKVTAEAG